MDTKKARGSSKILDQLFGSKPHSAAELGAAVAAARASGLVLEAWWWKGQPAFWDELRAKVMVPGDEAGATIDSLLKLNSPELQVGIEVFPRGVVQLEAVGLTLTVNRNIQEELPA